MTCGFLFSQVPIGVEKHRVDVHAEIRKYGSYLLGGLVRLLVAIENPAKIPQRVTHLIIGLWP